MGLVERLAKLSKIFKSSTAYPTLELPPQELDTRVDQPFMNRSSLDRLLEIVAIDSNKDNPENAFHDYTIYLLDEDTMWRTAKLCAIHFQKGALNETAPNGISNEALLAIVLHRLESFQTSPFKSTYNAEAISHLRKALEALHNRTKSRLARGVEGTHKV